MIEFVPYRPEHLMLIELQPAQSAWRKRVIEPGYAESLTEPGLSWTGFNDGLVVGCAGVVREREGLGKAWALIGAGFPRSWPAIVRHMRNVLACTDLHRIEADVLSHFGEGCRLAKMLSFDVEGLRRKYDPEGQDYFLYARVK
jgi:hypothetical protein